MPPKSILLLFGVSATQMIQLFWLDGRAGAVCLKVNIIVCILPSVGLTY